MATAPAHDARTAISMAVWIGCLVAVGLVTGAAWCMWTALVLGALSVPWAVTVWQREQERRLAAFAGSQPGEARSASTGTAVH